MNILPKKRWHVRTKDNIARVRRDEAQAAEEEKEQKRKALLAEQEARTELLRKKARIDSGAEINSDVSEDPAKHVNFFEDLEDGSTVTNATNKEYEKEKKEEKEKYEKQIGYLTYLGQDTVEATGNISWYNKTPERNSSAEEVGMKTKKWSDPLNIIRKHVGYDMKDKVKVLPKQSPLVPTSKIKDDTESNDKTKREKSKKKHKKHKKRHKCKHDKKKRHSSDNESDFSSSDSEKEEEQQVKHQVNLEQLRAERLKREQMERQRTAALLAKIRGEPPPTPERQKEKAVPVIVQKYNSQFNPELARQNTITY